MGRTRPLFRKSDHNESRKHEPEMFLSSLIMGGTGLVNPFTCLESDDVQKALDVMASRQVRRIPVIDQNRRIVGIIAQEDIATRLDEPEKTGELVAKISK